MSNFDHTGEQFGTETEIPLGYKDCVSKASANSARHLKDDGENESSESNGTREGAKADGVAFLFGAEILVQP